MYCLEVLAVEWTSLGLMKLGTTAASVPAWEYVVLMLLVTSIWLYHVLDFHFVGDLVNGFRGDVVRVFVSPASKLGAQILPKCEILKRRYWATPWLASPHLQTCFLHFHGRPPPIEYHRQLFITADGGTIALDWVKSHSFNQEDGDESKLRTSALDETPIVIIIPGLTSHSNDAYVKHIAHSTTVKGWRALVCNHRGLGGVSITSDQFYNAGWTEDLRRIIQYVHKKYPRALLFTIGTSIGANILVKYLGEEGAATPVGAAAAVCCPWDLVVCDRFISRNGVQNIYNKILASGLLEYAQLHQSALSRFADWNLLSKSKTIRDFDNYCTRLTGKFETVDTYYRRCSSANYLADVAVPLLCFNSLDDPVCTKEAIPWDEVTANPNVVLAVTQHGGHLACFEGMTAYSIWWVRALTEFMTFVIPSSLMHKPQRVPDSHFKTIRGFDIDKAPYINLSDSGQVAAQDLRAGPGPEDNGDILQPVRDGKSHESSIDQAPFVSLSKTGRLAPSMSDNDDTFPSIIDGNEQIVLQEENCLSEHKRPLQESAVPTMEEIKGGFAGFAGKGSSINLGRDNAETSIEREAATSTELLAEELAPITREDGSEGQLGGQAGITLHFKDRTELLALQSALTQLLGQFQSSAVTTDQQFRNHGKLGAPEASDTKQYIRTQNIAVPGEADDLKTSAPISSLQASSAPAIEVPIDLSVIASFTNCMDAAIDLAESNKQLKSKSTGELGPVHVTKPAASSVQDRNKSKTAALKLGSKRQLDARDPLAKGFAGLAAQNRRTLWLLTYIAVVTTFPLLGSALFIRARGRLTAFKHRWFK